MRYKFANWTLDLDNYLLLNNGVSVSIRPKTFSLLAYLAMNPMRLITRDEMLQEVWRGRCVCDESLTTCIKEIRKILEDKSQKYIVTRHGLGYQFVANVSIDTAAERKFWSFPRAEAQLNFA